MIVETVMEMLRDHQDVNNRFFFLGYNSDKLSRIQIIFHDLRSVNGIKVFLNETFSVFSLFTVGLVMSIMFRVYCM